MEYFVSFLSAGIGAGLMAIINTIVSHRLKKDEKEDARINALVECQKVMMIDRVRYLSVKFISDGEISLDNKETMKEMHKAYKALGGNGHLDTVMAEVEKLRVVE